MTKMVNDMEKIREYTGCKIGKLYYEDSEIHIKLEAENAFLYDRDSGNFHLVVDKENRENRHLVPKVESFVEQIVDMMENVSKDNSKIKIRKPSWNSKIPDKNMFSYLYYQTEKRIYQIMFVRFSNENQIINCAINKVQFYSNTIIGNECFKSWRGYPSSLEDGEKKVTCDTAVYYNPNVKVPPNGADVGELLKAFEEFMREYEPNENLNE